MTLRRADAVEASARCAHRRFADECRFGYFTEASLRFLHDFGATLIKSRHHAQNIVSTAAPRASQLNQALFRKITID
ncbi:hypothetical protein EYA88_09995 [Burkholderia pseudomallei]|nr:hypothetical protein EYA88_09995 [Burkholderia pseudomallei]